LRHSIKINKCRYIVMSLIGVITLRLTSAFGAKSDSGEGP